MGVTTDSICYLPGCRLAMATVSRLAVVIAGQQHARHKSTTPPIQFGLMFAECFAGVTH